MLQKFNKHNKDQGFTIIEVMIVLAIAGMIIAIVLLAVPNLQRTARNTSRKNDAAAIAAAMSNFIDNNGGSFPSGLAVDSAPGGKSLDLCATSGWGTTYSAGSSCSGNYETAKLGLYKPSAVTLYTTSTPTAATIADSNNVEIVTGYGCNSANTGLSASTVPQSAAILYALENSSGVSTQCVEQ
jgi:prepilin-type N-terminal cleavage/methylation domain-containing protein